MSPSQEVRERMQELMSDSGHAVAEVEKLLTEAETLLLQCEVRERKLNLTIVVLFASLLFLNALAELLGAIPELKGTRDLRSFSAACFSFTAFALTFIGPLCFRDWRRQVRDRATIHSIVDMLREVEGALTRNHTFSALAEQNLKLRLRRFDIGPSADAVQKK